MFIVNKADDWVNVTYYVCMYVHIHDFDLFLGVCKFIYHINTFSNRYTVRNSLTFIETSIADLFENSDSMSRSQYKQNKKDNVLF